MGETMLHCLLLFNDPSTFTIAHCSVVVEVVYLHPPNWWFKSLLLDSHHFLNSISLHNLIILPTAPYKLYVCLASFETPFISALFSAQILFPLFICYMYILPRSYSSSFLRNHAHASIPWNKSQVHPCAFTPHHHTPPPLPSITELQCNAQVPWLLGLQ